MAGFIAVHCGAGHHKSSLHTKYKQLCKKACVAAGSVINAGGSAVDACQVAIMILEEDPVTNAGFGSNLTIAGDVECDASVMDGETLNFGACGAVQGVKFPISLATQICRDQSVPRPLGLVPPSLLVGQGANDYAKMSNLTLVDNSKMISRRALFRYKRYSRLLKKSNPAIYLDRMDTIGAVCVDQRGHVAAASSSGGIFLKHNGRIGQAATYGCGTWADSSKNKTENSTAVTTTGCGEYLVKTILAREIAKSVQDSLCPVTAFHKTFKEEFLESKYLNQVSLKLGGALVLQVAPSGRGELIWGHTTNTMGIAYLDTSKKNPKSVISMLPADKTEGSNIIVSGVSLKVNIS